MTGAEWNVAEIDELIQLVHAEGLSNREVAERLGRSHSAVESAVHKFCTRDPAARLRVCMPCQKQFYSTHVGNRICGRCKMSVAYMECA